MKGPLLPETTYRQAVERWQAALDAAGVPAHLPVETVPLREAAGRVPARVVRTRRPSPTSAIAAMDGFAVAAQRLAGASARSPVTLRAGAEAIPVDTGSAVPPDCDAVVPLESVARTGDALTFVAAIAPGKHVRLPGEEVPPGVAVSRPGHALRPVECAALIAGGDATVDVFRRPRVAIIPTGNELIEPGENASPGTAFESNSTMIAAAAQLAGAITTVTATVRDDAEALQVALRSAAASNEVVVLLGGSSRGSRDQSLKALEALCRVVVCGVATRPAKPVNLALIGSVPVVNLPGYPVAAHVAFELYAAPLIRRLGGYNEDTLIWGRLTVPTTADGEADEWREVNLEQASAAAPVLGENVSLRGSYALLQADALLHVPRGRTELPSGALVELRRLRPSAAALQPIFIGPYDPLVEELAAAVGFRCSWSESAATSENERNLVGVTCASARDVARIQASLPGFELRVLGRRIEGIAVRASRASNGEPPAQTLGAEARSGNAWEGAASVAARLAPAAWCTAYVARQFELELVQPQAIWYIMLWPKTFEAKARFGQALVRTLGCVRSQASDFGWEHVEVDES